MQKSIIAFVACGLFSLFAVSSTFAENPCKPIAKACKQAGFYKGGNKEGKGLIVDCILPVSNGRKTLPNTNFSASTKEACKKVIMRKMKEMKD